MKRPEPCSRWDRLSAGFDATLPRRTAIMLKPHDGSRHFAYPAGFDALGYQFDEGMFAGYEEDPYLTIRLDDLYYPSLLGAFAAAAPLAIAHQEYRPDCVQREAVLATVGFRIRELFCRPGREGFHWRMMFQDLGDRPRHKPIWLFLVLSAPELTVRRVAGGVFSFVPARLSLRRMPGGAWLKPSPNQGLDQRHRVDRSRDGMAGTFVMHLAAEAAAWGSYDTTEAYREDARQGRLNQVLTGRRHLVLALRVDAEATPVNSARKRGETLTAYAERMGRFEFRSRSITLGLSYGRASQAAALRHCRRPEQQTQARWDRQLARLPVLKDRNVAAQKAYDKTWWIIELNRYEHPRFGRTWSEAPVYPGYWICNLPAMEMIARLAPGNNGRFFKTGMDLFCQAMTPGGVFPHALYLRERRYGRQWGETGSVPNSAWAVWRYYESTRDRRSLARWYSYLVRYYRHLCDEHDPEGLHLWAIRTLHDSFDTTPTSELMIANREPYAYTPEYSSERVIYEQTLARMARVLGRAAEAAEFEGAADLSRATLHARLWDESKHWFGVRHADGSLDSRVGVPGLFPLAYGLASARQIRAAKPSFERLLCRHGVRTFAKNQPGYYETYWRGPVWATSVLYGLGAAQRCYPDLVDRVYGGMIRYILAQSSIWELLEGDSGQPAVTDYGFLAGVAYGGASICGAAAFLSAFRMRMGEEFLPSAKWRRGTAGYRSGRSGSSVQPRHLVRV